jgi:nucleotide-binding universal stress UspA family protein
MIVVGRRGRSRLSKLLMGSTSSALVQTAPVPVVVVP